MVKNPLDANQREKSGATTFGKYDFQYHYALCKCMDEHSKNSGDYLIFVEFHEDVVFGNSMEPERCTFEFCQVKNRGNTKYNRNNLTKHNKDKNSVLGKLLQSTENRSFSDKIYEINLAASCGFKFDLKLEGENYEKVAITELSDECADFLLQAMQKEIGISKLPNTLVFTQPDIFNPSYRESAISKITELMTTLYPNSSFRPKNVYTALIDDLHRKGTVTYDFQDWQVFVEKKSITSRDIGRTIEIHTEHQSAGFQNKLQLLCAELDINALQQIALFNEVEQVRITQAIQADLRKKKIHAAVEDAISHMTNIGTYSVSQILDSIAYTIDNKYPKYGISIVELRPIILFHLAQ